MNQLYMKEAVITVVQGSFRGEAGYAAMNATWLLCIWSVKEIIHSLDSQIWKCIQEGNNNEGTYVSHQAYESISSSIII